MAEATFQPAVAPGSGVDSAISGVDAGQSMMQRASNLRASQQLEQIRAQEIQQRAIMLPVTQATAEANKLSAVASIANATRIQNLRGQAAAVSKTANDEFLDAMQLADFNSKATALAGLQAKYQWMSLIPEYKGFVDTINDERLKAHGSAIADANMERQLEQSDINYQRAVDVAGIAAGARQSVAETNAGSRETVADTNATARRDVAATSAGAKTDATDASMARTEVRGNLQSALEADKEAIKYEIDRNPEAAEQARKRAQQFRDAAKSTAHPAKSEAGAPFTVPGVTDQPKLYNPPTQPGETITLSPAVRTLDQVTKALQQAVNDGQISADDARETLRKLGYKENPKSK
jgi:hypothetical protein